MDRFQIVERLLPRCAPFGDGFDLGRRNFFVDLGIAVLRAQAEAFEKLSACSLAFLGPREMDPKPKMIGVVISGAEDFLCLRREGRHAFAAARAGADQDQAPHEVGRLKSDLLRDKAADRKSEHIDLRQSNRPDKRDGVRPHLFTGDRNLAGAAGDAGVVEQDHLPRRREAIRHRRIPMVHRPREMLFENERHPARLPEAAIGEADAVGLDELCWCGLVGVSHVLARMRHFWTGMNHHDLSSNYSARIASGTSARAAFAQSTSCCTVGAPLTPIAPTISPPTLIGKPPPYAATRASVGIPARSDGSRWIKLKKSWVETPNRAVYALFCAISMERIGAPSIRLKALRLPPSSRIATFSVTLISLAFATAASTIFCASSEEMLCFFPTLAIGLLPPLEMYCALNNRFPCAIPADEPRTGIAFSRTIRPHRLA